MTGGTLTATAAFTAKSVGACSLTQTSSAGNQSVTVYFSVTP
jgi:hypothetical protein